MKVSIIFLAAFVIQDKSIQDKDKGVSAQGVNLKVWTDIIQKQTKKKFMYTPDLNLENRKIYYASPMELSDDDRFRAYEAILQMHGLALIPVGEKGKEIYKIALASPQPGTQAGKLYPKIVEKVDTPHDEFVTWIRKLEHANAQEVANQLRIIGFQHIAALESSGVLVVTDYDHNLQRLEHMIKLADVPREVIEMKVKQLKNSLAPDIAKMLTQIVNTLVQTSTTGPTPGPRPPGTQQEKIQIVEDTRTNSLIILASKTRMPQIFEIIDELDKTSGYETTGIFVHTMRYSLAEDAAKILGEVFKVGTTSTGGVSPSPTTPTTGSPVTPVLARTLSIVADKKTNSLIVVTDRNLFKLIEQFLAKIDKRRPQVLIKATAIEIQSSDSFDITFELNRMVEKLGKASLGGRLSMGLSTLRDINNDGILDIIPADTTGINLAIFHEKAGNIPFLMNMLEGKATINVLDEPELITDDNQKAKITLDDETSYRESVITPTGPVQSSFKTTKATTSLEITPHITDFQQLKLDIDIKIEKFGLASEAGAPPNKSNRNILGAVNMYNGRTVVVGGVVTQSQTDRLTQAPFLSSIPILGELFKKTSKGGTKKTLYIFITPYILYDESLADLFDLSKERRDFVEKERGGKLNLQFDPKYPIGSIPSFRFAGPEDIDKYR